MIRVFHYPDIESLKAHVLAFVKTYDLVKHSNWLAISVLARAIARDRQTEGGRERDTSLRSGDGHLP